MRKVEKLHRHSAGHPKIAQTIEAMIDLLSQQIAELDRQIADFIVQDQNLYQHARLWNAVARQLPVIFNAMIRKRQPIALA